MCKYVKFIEDNGKKYTQKIVKGDKNNEGILDVDKIDFKNNFLFKFGHFFEFNESFSDF